MELFDIDDDEHCTVEAESSDTSDGDGGELEHDLE